MAIGPQLVAVGRGTSILPDDRMMQRFAGGTVPEDDRLPLVGDPQAGDLVGLDAGILDGALDDLDLFRPDLVGIMLDPTGLREELFEFGLGDATHRT